MTDISLQQEMVVKSESGLKGGRWQQKVTSLRAGLLYAFEKEKLCDIEFEVSKRIFKAHRIIVRARSVKIANMVLELRPGARIVDLTVSEKGFEILLRYMYTDEIGTTDVYEILEAHRAAKEYVVEDLVQKCEDLLCHWDISCVNVCTVLDKVTDISFLKERCLRYIKNNDETVLTSDDFLKASAYSVLDILTVGCFNNVPALTLIRNVIRWAIPQLLDVKDCSEVRDYLKLTGILGRLRIQELSSPELQRVFANYRNLLTSEEYAQFNVRNYYKENPLPDSGETPLPDSGETPLPEWCNQ